MTEEKGKIIPCRACGFTSPESLGYCDFCKEPFRKPKVEIPAEGEVRVPSELKKSVLKMNLQKPAQTPAANGENPIPEEFRHLDKGESIPVLSKEFRYMVMTGVTLLVMSLMLLAVGLSIRMKSPKPASPAEIPQSRRVR